jgi:hypothetical protein
VKGIHVSKAVFRSYLQADVTVSGRNTDLHSPSVEGRKRVLEPHAGFAHHVLGVPSFATNMGLDRNLREGESSSLSLSMQA